MTLYDTRGELKYGPPTPSTASAACPWQTSASGSGRHARTARLPCCWINSASDRYQLALLPGDGERYRNGNLVLAILPQVRP